MRRRARCGASQPVSSYFFLPQGSDDGGGGYDDGDDPDPADPQPSATPSLGIAGALAAEALAEEGWLLRRAICAWVRMIANGVRSSWEASAAKCRSASRACSSRAIRSLSAVVSGWISTGTRRRSIGASCSASVV